MESTFLSPRGPKENRRDHKRKLFYEFDKLYTVENWKTTLGSNDDNQSNFLRGQPVQDFEKEIHKIVSKIKHPSVKDPREILKSLLIPSPISEHLLRQYKQTKKNKGDMLSKNASGIRLQSNHIEVDMNIIDGEGGFRRIKHKYNPEKLQKKIIEKYSDMLTDKRYDTQTIVKKITREYSKALGQINRNGLMVKVPKNFKVWMQNYNDFYHERDEDDQDDYPDYIVQKQLDDYLDNKLNNEVDKTMDSLLHSESHPDLRKSHSPKKRVYKKSTFPDQDGTLNVSQEEDEEEGFDDEEEYDEDAEEDFEERMEKRRKQQLKNQQKRKMLAARASQNEVEDEDEEEKEDGENDEDGENEGNEEGEDGNEQFDNEEEGENIGGRLETKKSRYTNEGEEVVSEGEVEEEGETHGKKMENSQRFMKKKTTEEDRPAKKEPLCKERKTYSTVKKYEAIKITTKEPKQDPSQTPEAQRARQQEIEAEQKRLNDYYNERINAINNKYKDKTDDAKSPTMKKQNSKDSQAMTNSELGSATLQKQKSNQNNPQRDNSPTNLRVSQISSIKTENRKQSQITITGNTNSLVNDDLDDNDRESIREPERRPSPSAAISTKSSGGKKPSSSTNQKPFNIDINQSNNKKSTTSSAGTKKDSLQLAKRSSAADALVGEEGVQQDYSPMHKSTLSVQPNSKSPKSKNRDRARTHNESSSSAILKTDESPAAQKHTTQLSHFSPRRHLETAAAGGNTNSTISQHHHSKSKGPQKNGVMNLKKDDPATHRYSLSPGLKSQITDGTTDEEDRPRGNNKVPAAAKRVRSAKVKHPLPNKDHPYEEEEEEKGDRISSKYARQSSVPFYNIQQTTNDDYHNIYINQSTGPEPRHQRHHSSSSKPAAADKNRASAHLSNSHANSPNSKYKQEARSSVGLVKTQSPTRKDENGLRGLGYDFGYGKNLSPNNNHLRDRKQSNMSATLNISKNSSPTASRHRKETNFTTASKFGHDQNMLYHDAMNIIDTEFAAVSEVPVLGSKQSLLATEINSPETKKTEFDLDKFMQDIKNQNAKRSTTIIDMLLAAPSVMDNDIEVIQRPDYQIKVPQNLRFEDDEYKMLFGEIYTWHKMIKKDVNDSDPDYLSEIEDSDEEGEGEKKKDEEESTQRKEPESTSTKRNATVESSDEETKRDVSKLKKK